MSVYLSDCAEFIVEPKCHLVVKDEDGPQQTENGKSLKKYSQTEMLVLNLDDHGCILNEVFPSIVYVQVELSAKI